MHNHTNNNAQNISRATLLQLSTDLLRNGNLLQLTLNGYSMFPLLRKGDVVIIQPLDINEVKPGDVVVFHTPQSLVAHRLLKKKKHNTETVLITKGDYSPQCDLPVHEKDYIGIVIQLKRKKRIKNLRTPCRQRLNRFLARISSSFTAKLLRVFRILY